MKRLLVAVASTATLAAGLTAPQASAQDAMLGEVRPVAFTFCPRGFVNAHGQLLPIAQNTALFSLYGTTFGGDGRTTFGVPDLQGRTPMHSGNGPGLTPRLQGQKIGVERVTLSVAQMPSHNHLVRGSNSEGNTTSINNAGFGNVIGGSPGFQTGQVLNQSTRPDAITSTGGNQPHNNLQPSAVIRFCVAAQGIYPSRN